MRLLTIILMSNANRYIPPKPGDTEQVTVIRPAEDIRAEEEAERVRMHLDLEAGRITHEQFRKQNGIDCSTGINFTPFLQRPLHETQTDFNLDAWLKDPIPMILKNAEY